MSIMLANPPPAREEEMSQELSSAERLLLRNLQQFYKTGEVLELEFKLIHGEDKWDPVHRRADSDRARSCSGKLRII
jgi:hypothetical protein